jgi:type VI secretion system protein ImpC
VNAIIHHPDFQELEGSWRGLKQLVDNTEISTELKIKVLDISKDEIVKAFEKNKGAKFDQSPLFKKIYEAEYGMLRGEPFGCLVGDYQFSHAPRDVGLLAGMAKICAAAHVPFITGADPKLMDLDGWTDVNNPPDVARLFTSEEHAAWRSLRESEDSRYLGLTLPRVLARQPWSIDKNPVEGFAFDEDVEGATHEKFCWTNAAYAFAQNVNKSFATYGWSSQIVGVKAGGRVDGLPTHVFKTEGGSADMKCPTEVNIPQRREAELAEAGLIPLTHAKNTDWAVFVGAPSLHKPPQFNKATANTNARLGASLPYLFAASRFAHYLKKMVYDNVGRNMTREKLQDELQEWITGYVNGDPRNATEAQLAERPLSEAKVTVVPIDGKPGAYNATFHLVPHFKLEEVNVSLRLVGQVPAPGK